LHPDLAERPCDTCGPCTAVNQSRFLDLIEIDAASNTGVDDIRSLRDKINFSPSEGRYKVYIIDEVHMLSTAAFNALLKTLEEPPSHAIFILATTEEHKVPLTIKSRCQQFNFRLLTTQEIMNRLNWMADQESLSVEKEALLMIAHHGAGSLRDAESLLDQLVTAPGDTITLERAQMVLGTASNAAVSSLTDAVLSGDGPAGLVVIHNALSSGADARQFARQMVAYLRQVWIMQKAGGVLTLEVTAEQQAEIAQKARLANRKELIEAVKRFNEAATSQSGSWQPQLPLELAFLDLLPEAPGTTFARDFPSQPPAREQKIGPAKPVAPPDQKVTAVEKETPTQPMVQAQEPQPPDRPAEEPAGKNPPVQPVMVSVTAPTLHAVIMRWPEMRERVGQIDRNLPALLASCKPLAVEGTTLILGFDYPILRDKFDKKKTAKEVIAEVFSVILETKCAVRAVVTGEYALPSKTIEEDFVALANELGGVVRDK
jgi:DNA polymerase-3 subunit gamma/tau